MAKLIATEAQEQMALIEWANLTKLATTSKMVGHYLFHIPNEGKRSIVGGFNQKRLGLKKGVPDLFLAWPKMGWGEFETVGPYSGSNQVEFLGLFIEMKRREKAIVTKEQQQVMELLIDAGYKCVVTFGWEQARDEILEYLG